MTFSIVARCADSGQFGIAISSSSPAVAARCAFARAGVGVVATQNVTNPALGPFVLDQLAAGDDAPTAVAAAIAADGFAEYRQLLAVDVNGNSGVHSGANALGIWAAVQGDGCAAGGNLLADQRVPAAMVHAFATTPGRLGDRLIAALRAAVDTGGEAGPIHSAGLLIVDTQSWPYAELRIDWVDAGCPVEALARAWQVFAPQADAYVTRALNPVAAPTYGVPGDE